MRFGYYNPLLIGFGSFNTNLKSATMPIKIKAIERGQPGVKGGGQKKFYATIVLDGEVTMDDLVRDIEKFSALSEPDIRGVIVAMENVIQNKLIEGKIVRLERLGSLYPVVSSNGETKEANVTSSSVRDIYINYRPGDRLQKTLKDAQLQKVK